MKKYLILYLALSGCTALPLKRVHQETWIEADSPKVAQIASECTFLGDIREWTTGAFFIATIWNEEQIKEARRKASIEQASRDVTHIIWRHDVGLFRTAETGATYNCNNVGIAENETT